MQLEANEIFIFRGKRKIQTPRLKQVHQDLKEFEIRECCKQKCLEKKCGCHGSAEGENKEYPTTHRSSKSSRKPENEGVLAEKEISERNCENRSQRIGD